MKINKTPQDPLDIKNSKFGEFDALSKDAPGSASNGTSSKSSHRNELYEVAKSAKGFEEDMLDEDFDHLVNDEKARSVFYN
nr:hypothetical protein CFP56_42748 [Quercus suber]